jgi:undecaprenyl diphosphate synthase
MVDSFMSSAASVLSLTFSLKKELPTLQENNIRLITIGNTSQLPDSARKQLAEVTELTKNNNRMTLTLALSYGSREEIISAVKAISEKVKDNTLAAEDINESTINNHLYTHSLPDVDLVIRTSGDLRISNFLLWQIAYAEFYFTDVFWPDFKRDDFLKAVIEYQSRERRFGKTSEQIKKSMQRIKIIVLFVVVLFSRNALIAQEITENNSEKTSLFEEGKKYTLGGISVVGVQQFSEKSVKVYSGLKTGMEIKIPGDKLSSAIKKLYGTKRFSTVEVYIDKLEGASSYLEIKVTETPQLNNVDIKGVKKSKAKTLQS